MVALGRFLSALATLLVAACNVPEPPGSSGGVSLQSTPCGRGVVVVSSGSDYASTNVSLADLDGVGVSPSFLSSGAVPAGASAAFSGDVVAPLQTPPSGNVVLIDRQNGTVSWADPVSATVRAQLSLLDGLPANPHDYVEVSADKAYVSRYGAGDLAVVDLRSFEWTASVPLPADTGLRPSPDRMLLAGDRVIVALQLFAAAFVKAGDGRLVGIDTASDAIAWTVELAGLANCGGLAMAPDSQRIAVTCTGVFPGSTSTDPEQMKRSAVVWMDLSDGEPEELRRYDVAAALGRPVGWTVGFVSNASVVGRVVGDLESGSRDAAFSLDLESGEVKVLAESAAYSLGDVRCAAACGKPCLMADAETGVLRRWSTAAGTALVELEPSRVDTTVGLPPRNLGGF